MTEKQPIHPEIQKILDIIPPASTTPPDPVSHRAQEESQVAPVDQRQPQLDVVEDQVATTEVGDVPVRIYAADADAENYGVIVYFHGGAFFSGSINTHDHVARALAKETGKKAAAALNYEVYLQVFGHEYSCQELAERCKADFRANNKGAIRSCKLYVKPEDGMVYYVVNSKHEGKLPL